MESVARGDGPPDMTSPLTRYYAESGTPPGRFLGAGLAGVNNANGTYRRPGTTRDGFCVTHDVQERVRGPILRRTRPSSVRPEVERPIAFKPASR